MRRKRAELHGDDESHRDEKDDQNRRHRKESRAAA